MGKVILNPKIIDDGQEDRKSGENRAVRTMTTFLPFVGIIRAKYHGSRDDNSK
jgi:hypothetical protein